MPRQTNTPASRERRLRRTAQRKGFFVLKIASGRDRGRFILEAAGEVRPATARTYSLDEAEAVVEMAARG